MTRKETARLKKLVWAAIAVSVLATSIKPAQAQSHQNYFPLNIGNSWTYTDGAEEKTFIITGTEQINGHTYYKFDDYVRICGFPGYDSYPPDDNDIFFRYDPCSDTVLQYWPSINEDRVRYDFSQNTWGDGGNQLIQTGLTCTVPAGTFDSCCKFRFATDLACGDFNEMLAPGVGNIRFDTPETGTFELKRYTIASPPSCGDPDYPYPAGDLNYDCRVDFYDFAIFAANWLERENQRPQVYISSPQDGTVHDVKLDPLAITAEAWDIDGWVVKVKFFVDGCGFYEDNDGSNGWHVSLTLPLPLDTYSLTAKATDNEGATAISPPVTITIVDE